MTKQTKTCLNCGKGMSRSKRSDARYCTDRCRKNRAEARRRARNKAIEEGIVPDAEKQSTRQNTWLLEHLADRMEEDGYYDAICNNKFSMVDVQHLLGVAAQSQVSRAFKEVERRRLARLAAGGWRRESRVDYFLAFDIEYPDLLDVDAAWKWANLAADRFLAFEFEYMELPNGDPWIREDFHRTWIVEVLFAIATGGYLQILSPPRHGKTELLTHFVVWLICRNPNVRILWIGPNDEKAKEVVAKVKEILELNERLIADTLPTQVSYAPQKRQGVVWQSSKFKVANRSSGIAGNTMLGVGRGAKILSLNADIIIGDDIEDHDSTLSETDRRKTRRWFGTQLDSRKEEHTALFLIGSRQHVDDLYSYNIEDPNFRVVINSAHSPDCDLPEIPNAAHQDCMLFPQLRSYRWLMTKKYGAEARNDDDGDEEGLYEMVYLNDPQRIDFTVFTKAVVEPSFNAARRLGLEGIPERDRRTVGSLDPSATGYQVAWVWATTPVEGVTGSRLDIQDRRMKRWMVDYDNRLGGGIDNFLLVAEDYRVRYDVHYWVIEDNGFQYLYLDDPRTQAWARRHDVYIDSHHTDTNKHDKLYGVSAMKRLFIDNLIDLPYGDAESRRKTDAYVKQLYKHLDEPGQRSRSQKTDIKMAAWFPTKVIRRWEKEAAAAADRQRNRTDNPYPLSYAQLSGFSQQNTPPWR